VGQGKEHDAQATLDAYDDVARRIAALSPKLIILTTSHGELYRNALRISTGPGAQGDFAEFRDPDDQLKVTFDEKFIAALIKEAEREGLSFDASPEPGGRLDHGCLVPLYFILQHLDTPCKVVRVAISFLDEQTHYRMGQCIARAVNALDRRAVFVASGDLSHRLKPDGPYGFNAAGPQFDQAICEAFATGDFDALMHFSPRLRDEAAECGLNSFIIMAGALDGLKVESRLLSYEGPWGVGYGIARFTPAHSLPVKLAFAALADWLAGFKEPSAKSPHIAALLNALDKTDQETLEELYSHQAGTFVSFHKGEDLRGCIGTIEATRKTIFDEICQNTVSAAGHDPRFSAIRDAEVPTLSCTVDFLGQAEPVSGMDELDAKRFGVIVSKGFRRGLLLPDLEGVDTPREQIAIALRKAGIAPDESYDLERFEVVHYE
jgi:AmmeMemoRadiSam system protein A